MFKKTLFIDANIYLRFFDSKSSEFKKLLRSIIEIKDSIFVTKQIEFEVNRNKLAVFLSSFDQISKQLYLEKGSLPEHLETSNQQIKKWNKIRDDLQIKIGEQKKILKEITLNLLESISNDKDSVSKALAKLFAKSKEASDAELMLAKKRKEIGNPPGKRSDPLGDQISWEQLLSNAKEMDEIWIVTRDSDYALIFENKSYLNPFLLNELRKRNRTIKINCFNTLSEGLNAYNKSLSKKIESLPKEQQLISITKEENIVNAGSIFYSSPILSGAFLSGSAPGIHDSASYIGGQTLQFGPTGPIGYVSENNFIKLGATGSIFTNSFQKICSVCNNPYPLSTGPDSFVFSVPETKYCPTCGRITPVKTQ